MRMIKLAFRTVLSWRGSVYAAVAAVALVSAVVTLAGSVLGPVQDGIAEAVRRTRGELAGTVPRTEIAALTDELEATGALASVRVEEAGALDSIADLLLVPVVRGDLDAELAFRGLSLSQDEERGEFASGDAVLLARGEHAEENAGRISRLFTRDQPEGELVQIVDVAPGRAEHAELLLHDPLAVAGGTSPNPLRVLVRGGRKPLTGEDGALARFGLAATEWERHARRITRPLSRSVGILTITLAALALGTLVPGQLLLARRASHSFELLSAWGFPRRSVAGLALLMGALSSGIAASAGAGIGLGIAAFMNAGMRPAVELLPLELANAAGTAGAALAAGTALAEGAANAAPVTPAIGWALGSSAAATLLGALTALPSAGLAATLQVRRGLWQ